MAAANLARQQCPHCGRELVEGRDYTGPLSVCPFCYRAVPPPMPMAGGASALGGFAYPEVDLSRLVIAPEVLTLVPAAIAREKRLLPLALEDDVLTVAMAAPPPPELLDSLRFLVNHPIAVALTAAEALAAALEQCYPDDGAKGPKSDARGEPSASGYTRPKPWFDLEKPPSPFEKMLEPEHESVLPMVQTLLRDAYQLGASRLLIFPYQGRVKVGYRLQNTVYVRDDLPPEMLYPILCTLITMTDLSGFIKVSIAKQERQIHLTFSKTEEGVSALVDLGEDTLAREASQQRAARLGYTFIDLEELLIPRPVLDLVPARVARAHRVVPLTFDGEKVTLVMASPRDPETLDQIRFALNRPLTVVLAFEGAIVAAIEDYYGSADPEAAALMRPPLLAPRTSESPAATAEEAAPAANHPVATVLRDYLQTVYREPMFAWFEEVRANTPLCQAEAVSRDLKVVFPHAAVIEHMPAEAQRFIDKKIWVFREAIISQLEMFLERDPLARGLAASYALYLASCQWAEGKPTSSDPGSLPDAWLNCMYALLVRCFPALTTNGAVAKFLAERPQQLSAQVAALLSDAARVVEPAAIANWFAQLERQTSFDEPIDGQSPLVVHLWELLLAKAMRGRASELLLLPQEEGVEVVYRVQTALYRQSSFPLRLWFPLLARLGSLLDAEGHAELTVEGKTRQATLQLQVTPTGLAVRVEVPPDRAAVAACQDEAAIAGLRIFDVCKVEVPAPLLAAVPKSVVWKKRVLPLGLHGQELVVAMLAPPTPRQLAELKLLFRRPIAVVLAPEDALVGAIYRHLHPASAAPQPSSAARALLQPAAPRGSEEADGNPAGSSV